jgi:hypothetical protein
MATASSITMRSALFFRRTPAGRAAASGKVSGGSTGVSITLLHEILILVM